MNDLRILILAKAEFGSASRDLREALLRCAEAELIRFARRLIAEEREACAKICEDVWYQREHGSDALDCEARIRARK